ncbi:MAG: hypothetical protein JNN20_10240 [Betaproteobacteria bacterium]|nr:hypothetical protein [Betaproteobacteria bacterium]
MKNFPNKIVIALSALVWGSFANPVAAAITIYFTPGASCNSALARSGAAVGRVASGVANPQVSVCMTATTESICGVTLYLEADAAKESGFFQIVGRKTGTIYPDDNLESSRGAVALKYPLSREDFGGIRPEPAKPYPPAADQLLTTLTIAPLAAAKAANYSIRVATGSMAVVAKAGSCETTEAVPISGSFVVERQ